MALGFKFLVLQGLDFRAWYGCGNRVCKSEAAEEGPRIPFYFAECQCLGKNDALTLNPKLTT